MSRRKGHVAGRLFGRRHTTVTDDAGRVARFLEKQPGVKKIGVGPIQRKTCAFRRIAVRREQNGLQITICGPQSIQILYVHGENLGDVEKAIKAFKL